MFLAKLRARVAEEARVFEGFSLVIFTRNSITTVLSFSTFFGVPGVRLPVSSRNLRNLHSHEAIRSHDPTDIPAAMARAVASPDRVDSAPKGFGTHVASITRRMARHALSRRLAEPARQHRVGGRMPVVA